ncbi:hypothetical protein ACI2KR_08175 [Pseudomonas luteola]
MNSADGFFVSLLFTHLANMNNVFALVMFDNINSQSFHTRIIGIYTDLETAQGVLMRNELDVSEGGSNRLALIEETTLNETYAMNGKEWWFEFDSDISSYKPCEKPDRLHKIRRFSIG